MYNIKTLLISLIFFLLGILFSPIILWFVHIFSSTSDEFKLGLTTAFISTIIAIYSHKKAKEREADARLFKQKSEAYEKIFNLIKEQFKHTKKGTSTNEKRLVNDFFDINYSLLVWGSYETINCWINIQSSAEEHSTDPFKKMLPWANLYASMRRDIGHNDKNMKPMKLISIHLDQEGRNQLKKSGYL